MTYLPFCKVKFKTSEKPHVIPHTAMAELWSCTQESTMPVLHIIGHDRAQGYCIFYPQSLGIKYHTRRRNLQTVNVHDHLKKLFPAFEKPAHSSDLASQFLQDCSYSRSVWLGTRALNWLPTSVSPSTKTFSSGSMLFITWCFRPYFFYITKTKKPHPKPTNQTKQT